MYRMDLFQRLLVAGLHSVQFPYCNWGTPFQKASWWLGNNPFLTELEDSCDCGHAGKHFRVRGVFDAQRLASFKRLSRPSAKSVFGRDPRQGEHVARFLPGYPIPLCDFVANLNRRQINLSSADVETVDRPLSKPPHWVAQLGRSLPWKKPNHINVNEQLSHRSLLKHVSKTYPHSRFCTLLDSRVVIGCNAQGRSSSRQLNFYLSSSLPYVVGGDLYPFHIHVAVVA